MKPNMIAHTDARHRLGLSPDAFVNANYAFLDAGDYATRILCNYAEIMLSGGGYARFMPLYVENF